MSTSFICCLIFVAFMIADALLSLGRVSLKIAMVGLFACGLVGILFQG